MKPPADMTTEDYALLAWAQLAAYVDRLPSMSKADARIVRDALCNAAADIHAGVKR